MSFSKFLIAVTVGRSIRYFMWGILAVVYGQLVKEFLENNLHTLGFLLVLLFFGALISYVWVWNRAKRKAFDQEIT